MKRFKKVNKKKKVIIGFLVVILIGLVLIQSSYAFFQRENEVRFISAKVGDFRVTLGSITATSTNNSVNLSYTAGGLNPSTTCTFGTTKGTYNLSSTTVNNSACTKTGLTQNTTYYYKVCTKNKLNQESCKEGSINTKYDPPTLSSITATSTRTSINLSYTESGTVSTRICKYGTSNGSYTTNAASQTSTKCSITGLTSGVTYYYQVCVSNNEGQNCKTGEVETTSLSDDVHIGDYISITPTSRSYTISKDVTGYTNNQTINPSELKKWRVLRKIGYGRVEVISDTMSSKPVRFKGLQGYVNLVSTLNEISKQYTDGINVRATRHLGYREGEYNTPSLLIENTEKLTQTTKPWDSSISYPWGESVGVMCYAGTKEPLGWGDCGYFEDYKDVVFALGNFEVKIVNGSTPIASTGVWLSSRYYGFPAVNSWGFAGRMSSGNGEPKLGWLVRYENGRMTENSAIGYIRPILELKSLSTIKNGTGTKDDPYVLSEMS